MHRKTNSATRLQITLAKCNSIPDNTQALDGWCKVFNIPDTNPSRKAVAASSLLQTLHKECELAQIGLQKQETPPKLYESAFSRIENALSPMLLGTPWSNIRQSLAPETMTALAFCAHILPSEEQEISSEDLARIREALFELKDTLTDASLSVRLRELISNHISLIERALCEYQIRGAIAFREAGRTALGEVIETRDEIAATKNHSATSKLQKTWNIVNQATDVALKAEQVAQLGQRAWDAISSIL